jgi:hypothetical protein
MVISAENLAATVPVYRTLIGGATFMQGQKYEEYHSGDKVAKYGLIGLMTGGAAVVAVKAWKPLMKVGAILIGLIAAGLAKLKSFFRRKSPKVATAGAGAPAGAAAEVVLNCPVCGQANRVRTGSDRPVCARCKAALI